MKMKVFKKNISEFLTIMKSCIRLSWRTSPFYTVLRFAGLMLIPLMATASSYLGKYVINLLAGAWLVPDPMLWCIFLLLGIFAAGTISAGLNKLVEYASKMHEDKLNTKITLDIMDSALSVDLECFDNAEYYDKLQAANNDAYAAAGILWNVLTFFSYSVSFISVFILMCTENSIFALLITAAAVPSAIVGTLYTKVLYDFSIERINQERQKGYYQGIATSKEYAQDIRLYRIGNVLKEKYERIWRTLFDKERKLVRKRTALTIIFDCLPEIVSLGIGIFLARQILNGLATVGDYSLYTGLISQLISASTIIISSVMQIYDNRLRISNLTKLAAFKSTIKDNGKEKLTSVETITFKNVFFTYPGTDIPVLKGLDFTLSRREKTAFVGLNGSGKSTMIKLMLRLYEPQKGQILINGKDIGCYTIDSVRDNFSVYFQEMLNYCFSLRDNVAIGDISKTAGDSAVTEALRESCADDILQKASGGLDTQIMRILSEDGLELSGGQHQKLALSRTFYRNRSVLVLDEPSSSLDPKAEHDIFKALEKLCDGRLTIFTSHRLSNTYLADRIIVMEKGRIIEDGTQAQLLKNNSRYAELFKYQQEKFQVSPENEAKSIHGDDGINNENRTD